MNEQKILGLLLVLMGLVGGFTLGLFVGIAPTSDPYRSQEVQLHLICTPVNGTFNCAGNGETTLYFICVKSLWWTQVCFNYRKVDS